MSKEKLITPKEASEILGVSKQSLINWEREGFLTAVKTFGGHRRYFEKEIKEILESGKKD